MLNAYVFRSGDEIANIEDGPRRLAQASVDSGDMARCTVERMWRHFMRREPTADEAQSVLPELQTQFQSQSYDLKFLVKAIVQQPAYARVP